MLKNSQLNKLKHKNLKNICRLCLIGEDNSLSEISGTKIISMIKYCLDIKIVSEDLFSTLICLKCFRLISRFYTFKRRTEKNEHVLKKAVKDQLKTKDIINIALEKSDINTLELNEIPKAETINNCFIYKNEVEIKINKSIKQNEPTESQIDEMNIYQKPNIFNETQDFSLKPNNLNNLDSSTFQKQHSLCFNFNIEPPPLAPLHSTDSKQDTSTLLENNKKDILLSQNHSRTSILLPPPLVPINPLKIHTKSDVSNEAKLICNICMKKFESIHFLQEHKLKSNCRINNHECNICKKTFVDQKKLIIHLKGHKTFKDYLCNICGKRYPSPSAFRIHYRSHTGERPFKCNICGKGFVRWAGVKNHMVTHEDAKPYRCETCGKQFKVSSNLYRHQRLHTGNYTFRCGFCDKAFSQSNHLKLHIRTYHTNEKPYLCCECGKGFVSFQRLKRHELVHSGQKPYPCPLCRRAYSNAIDLKIHNLRVHNKAANKDELKKYVCSACDLKFRHPCRLTKHMNTHKEANKNCISCGQGFKCAQALTRHLKTSSCKNVAMEIRALN